MENFFERKINYYETDKMGVVHHSNYIRFLEEARCSLMNKIGLPFSELEKNGVTIPVLEVNCIYKHHVTFEDTIIINTIINEYNGVRMTINYEVKDKENQNIILTAETKHCFTDKNLKPINLKKHFPEFSKKFEEILEKK